MRDSFLAIQQSSFGEHKGACADGCDTPASPGSFCDPCGEPRIVYTNFCPWATGNDQGIDQAAELPQRGRVTKVYSSVGAKRALAIGRNEMDVIAGRIGEHLKRSRHIEDLNRWGPCDDHSTHETSLRFFGGHAERQEQIAETGFPRCCF
jgi:hypothetical protein